MSEKINISKKEAQSIADELSDKIYDLIHEAQRKISRSSENISFNIEEPDYGNGGYHPKYKVTFSVNYETVTLIE